MDSGKKLEYIRQPNSSGLRRLYRRNYFYQLKRVVFYAHERMMPIDCNYKSRKQHHDLRSCELCSTGAGHCLRRCFGFVANADRIADEGSAEEQDISAEEALSIILGGES